MSLPTSILSTSISPLTAATVALTNPVPPALSPYVNVIPECVPPVNIGATISSTCSEDNEATTAVSIPVLVPLSVYENVMPVCPLCANIGLTVSSINSVDTLALIVPLLKLLSTYWKLIP